MRKKIHRLGLGLTVLAGVLLVSINSARGQMSLAADYTFDESGFFSSVPAAKLALEAAISDLNDALNQDLGAIPIASRQITKASETGFSSVTMNFQGSAFNPSRDGLESFDVNLEQRQVRMFVGARPLPFTSNGQVLGSATIGLFGLSSAMTSSGNGEDPAPLVRAIEQEAQSIFRRGQGPVIRTTRTNVGGVDIQIDAGLMHSTISFDNDANNNSVDDLAEGLDPGTLYHYDHTSAVPGNKLDFYTIALHEAMHAIGLGDSDTWNDLVDGNDWLGQEVIDFVGSGSGIIDRGAHVQTGFRSRRLSDGFLQESVLTATARRGQRKGITELDMAFFRDIGFSGATVAVPEPNQLAVIGLGLVVTALRRRKAAAYGEKGTNSTS